MTNEELVKNFTSLIAVAHVLEGVCRIYPGHFDERFFSTATVLTVSV